MLLANLLGDARVLAKIKNFSASAAKRGEGHMSSQVAWRRRGKDPLFAARRRATTSTTGALLAGAGDSFIGWGLWLRSGWRSRQLSSSDRRCMC
jgi:hypothetical protein